MRAVQADSHSRLQWTDIEGCVLFSCLKRHMNPEYRILEGSIVGIKMHVDIMDVNEEEVEAER